MAPNPLAKGYVPDFSEADPFTNTDWTTAASKDVPNALLSQDLNRRAAGVRTLSKGGASVSDYLDTAALTGDVAIKGVIDSVVSGFTLPHDVMTGEVDPLSPEGIARALDMAGLMAGGGLTEKAGPGKLGSSPMRPAPRGDAMTPAGEPFYSAIDRAIESAKTNSASPQQWIATIKNAPGVKQEEIDWLGLNDMLGKHEGPVSKQQLQEFIDQNKIQLEETWKKGKSSVYELEDDQLGLAEEQYRELNPDASEEEVMDYVDSLQEELLDQEIYTDTKSSPKYADYATPGAENYRELLLRIPEKKAPQAKPVWESADPEVPTSWVEKSPGSYHSSHWDESNVIGHLRMSDRYLDVITDADIKAIESKIADSLGVTPGSLASGSAAAAVRKGAITPKEAEQISQYWGWQNQYYSGPAKSQVGNKSLFLEELQSDWHQAGRKGGYTVSVPQEIQQLADKATGKQATSPYVISPGDLRWAVRDNVLTQAEADRLTKWTADNPKAKWGNIPDAPFKKTWPDLLLKRAVKEAVDGGYDSISWTSGATQAARYDLSKQIDGVKILKRRDGSLDISAKRKGGTLYTDDIASGISIDKVADYVGKDLAEKIKHQDIGEHLYTGIDLKVGGEGMKAFYDKELPARARKLFKTEVETKTTDFHSEVDPEHLKRWVPTVNRKSPAENGAVAALEQSEWNIKKAIKDTPEGDTLNVLRKWYNIMKNDDFDDFPEVIHVMKLTPELKERVRRGQPLFSTGIPTPGDGHDDQNLSDDGSGAILRPGALRLVPVDHNPFARGGR